MDEVATRLVQGLIFLFVLVGFWSLTGIPPIVEWPQKYREWRKR